MRIRVRLARPGDIGDTTDIALRAGRQGFRGVVAPELMPDRKALASAIGGRVVEDGPPIAVAELAGDLCGWVSFGASRDGDAGRAVGEIWALNVDPDVWRRGVGRALVDYALGRMRKRGYIEATLWTFRDTPRSRSFYEALGFSHDGATQRRQMSGGALEVRYRISLRKKSR